MSEKKTALIPVQTFFVSMETSNCPLIADILRLEKKVQTMDSKLKGQLCISMKYGKRMLINAQRTTKDDLTQETIVEVVDFDPIKNVMLVIGKKNPCRESPVHWMIHHARDDINIVLELTSKSFYEQLQGRYPGTEKETPQGTIERTKDVLRLLQKDKILLIQNEGVLFAGVNIPEIEQSLTVVKEKL